jgi:hypothetical protein
LLLGDVLPVLEFWDVGGFGVLEEESFCELVPLFWDSGHVEEVDFAFIDVEVFELFLFLFLCFFVFGLFVPVDYL